jgi:ligand-binding sensor domain-containing protein
LRFDVVRFTPWSAPIASPPFFHPISVRAGEFWIATRSELAHVRGNVVISRYDFSGIQAIYKDSDGSVWTLDYPNPDRVLCQATDTKIRCFGAAEGVTINVPSSFIPDGKGGFWIGGDTSLLHWKMGAAPEIYSPQHLQSNVGQDGIHDLLEDSDGSLLVGITAHIHITTNRKLALVMGRLTAEDAAKSLQNSHCIPELESVQVSA